jgi:uncharacterized protein
MTPVPKRQNIGALAESGDLVAGLSTDDESAAASQRSAPASRAERIEAIDALRGLALFGVLMVNLVTEFRVSIFAQFLPQPELRTGWDRLVMTIVSTGLETKAFCLFSLLFGVGLAIQFERLQSRPDRLVLLLRRMAALLLFGLIHLFLIWNGDILTEYAVVGLLVTPLLFRSRRALGVSSAVLLAFYLVMPLLRLPITFPGYPWIAQHVAQANAAYAHGDYRKVLAFNVQEVRSLAPLHVFVLARTLGLFTLGAWLWRMGLFRSASGQVFAWGGVLGIASGVLLTVATGRGGWLHRPGLEAAAAVADQAAPILLAMGYGGVILMLAAGTRTRGLVAWAAPLGRTAFTSYLLQSVIFGWVFYGYGLGLFDRLDPGPAFALGLAVYLAQVLASTLWLRRFQFGPMEWLWRGLMYGHRPPLRLSTASATLSP